MKAGPAGLLLALLVTACRPTPTPTPAPPEHAEASADPSEPGSPEPRDAETPAPTPERFAAWTDVGEVSPCERSCANVHACVVLEGRPRAAAATIELGCLDACVRATEAFTRCEWPSTLTADRCASSLTCIRAAWSTPTDPHTPTVIEPASDGCDLACAALARCHDRPIESAETCARQCRKVLPEAQQLVARDCAALEGCSAIEDCVLALPGA